MRPVLRRLASLGGGAYAVLERDFLVTTSSWRFLAVRLAVAMVAAFVVAVTAMAGHDDPPDAVGRAVLSAAVAVVPLLVLLIAPVTAAPAISSEREGGTLDLVLAAPVRASTLVLSKFASRFLSIAVLVLAMLPVAGICFLFGGVPFETFVALVVFALTTAAFGVATGLAFSAYLRSVAAAVLGAFLFVVAAPPVPLAIVAVLHGSDVLHGPVTRLMEPFLPFQTFWVWGQLGESAARGGAAPAACWLHAGAMSVVSAVLLVIATVRMRREGRVSPRRARRRRTAAGLFLGHPLLDRAVRGSILWHPRKRGLALPALAVVGDGVLVWGAGVAHELREPWVHVAGLGSLTALGLLRMLATTSASVSTERKRGSLDLLLATPYRHDQIARGLLGGALLSTGPLFLIGLLHGTAAVFFGALHPAAVSAWALTSFVLLLFAGALGLRVSASATSPTRSALLTFGIAFGGIAGVILVGFVMAALRLDGDLAGALLGSLPPVLPYYATWLAESVMTGRWYDYDSVSEVLPLGSLPIYLVLAIALFHASVRTLRRVGA